MLLRRTRRVSRAGFTLMEILVVVAIIVVLASVAVPITLGRLTEAKRDVARTVCKSTLTQAVKAYQMKHDEQLPSSLDELVSDPAIGLKRDMLLDPWKHPYHYQQPGSHNVEDGFDIWSGGPSGNEQIGNW
jgi:general secretion pathway protein G